MAGGWTPKRRPKHFAARVVGVTFGDRYPEALFELEQLQMLRVIRDDKEPEPVPAVLIRRPDNEHDANAVEVHIPALDAMIGHVQASVAAWLGPAIDDGAVYQAGVVKVEVHPDHPDRPGITLKLSLLSAAETDGAPRSAT